MKEQKVHKLLVVEDDSNLRMTLEDLLELEGYEVCSCKTVAEATSLLSDAPVDLIVLDVMLPDGNGYQLCQYLREQGDDVLVLMLTARNLEQDVIDGFISGADDYVTKPYKSQELLLRINALLRRKRQPSPANQHATINGCTINWSLRSVDKNGTEIPLTKTAFDILQFLFSNQNKVISRNEILDEVWGENVYVDSRTVDNFVLQLKKALDLADKQGDYIKSIRGVGYSLIIQKSSD